LSASGEFRRDSPNPRWRDYFLGFSIRLGVPAKRFGVPLQKPPAEGAPCTSPFPCPSVSLTAPVPSTQDDKGELELPSYATGVVKPDCANMMPPVIPISALPFDQQAVATVRPRWFYAHASPAQKKILDLAWDPSTFRSCVDLSNLPSPVRFPHSSLSFRHARELIKSRYFIFPCSRILSAASSFLVRKKNNTARPIINPQINKLFSLPEKMALISPRDLLQKIFHFSWALVADNRSWFSQIKVHPHISHFFGLKIGKLVLCLAVLGQGWKGAPLIAHTATKVLITGLNAEPWIDNLIFFGHTPAAAQAQFDEYAKRCDESGTVIKDEPHVPLQTPVFVGFDIDMGEKKWRLDPTFVSTALPTATKLFQFQGQLPLSQWWRLCGLMFWVARVYLLPMAQFSMVRLWMSRMAQALDKGFISWNSRVDLPLMARKSFSPLFERLANNPWAYWTVPAPTRILVTDASLWGGAFISPSHLVFWSWSHPWPSSFMPWLELKVIYWGLVFLVTDHSRSCSPVHFQIYSDCKPTVGMINSMRSHSPACDLILMNIFHMIESLHSTISAVHIPSGLNYVDIPSRYFQEYPFLMSSAFPRMLHFPLSWQF